MKQNAIYLGIDNTEEVEIVLTPRQRKDVAKIAKFGRLTELELLARYVTRPNLAALSGIAAAERLRRAAARKKRS